MAISLVAHNGCRFVYGAILPDRVEIQVTSSSTGALSKKNPIVYASNVVKQ